MIAAFLICTCYAFFGFLYSPSEFTIFALIFIVISASPLLLAGRASIKLPAVDHNSPSAGIICIGVFIGFSNLALIAISAGYSVVDLLDPNGFVLIAADSTTKRYTEGGSSGNPVLLAISLTLCYSVGASAQRLSVISKFSPFIPTILYTLLSTEKWPTFLGGAFYIVGVFAGQSEASAMRKIVRTLLLFSFLGLALGVLALIMRGYEGDLLLIPAQLLHYILAPFHALGYWLTVKGGDLAWGGLGRYTFIGIATQLGVITRDAGVYSENVTIYGIETNIYSSWRYLVEDWSVVGPVSINLALSLIFLLLIHLKFIRAAHLLRCFLILCAVLSLNVTPFVHNSVSLAAFLALSLTYLQDISWRKYLRAGIKLN